MEGSVHFKNSEQILIGSGTVIEHGAFITGPCVIGANSHIRKGAYLRENCFIGNGTLIGNSVEIKNSIILDKCQIAHFNYVGDSVLGRSVHFGAGAITSNYKLDGGLIRTSLPSEQGVTHIQTDLNKFGSIIGNNVEIGCNSVLNPGTIIGKNSVIYPLVNWRGFLPSQKICKNVQDIQIV